MDMLIPLYDKNLTTNLCPWGEIAALEKENIKVIRPLPGDHHKLLKHFDLVMRISPGWLSELQVALTAQPVTCFIAVDMSKPESPYPVGFSCFDATAKGLIGPIAVDEEYRRRGIASAIVKRSLYAMSEMGYAYAVVGWVSSSEFYSKNFRAMPINNSDPGLYSRLT